MVLYCNKYTIWRQLTTTSQQRSKKSTGTLQAAKQVSFAIFSGFFIILEAD